MTALDTYDWIGLTARRATGDIAWQYGIDLHGSTIIPPTFRRLEYEPDSDHCIMIGDPTEYSIDNDYPASNTSLTAYSYGYYLKNPIRYEYRQSKAGIDIPEWERSGSNWKGETSRTSEIKSYENPTYHLKRLLWPLDANGNVTSEKGYYNLYLGRLELVPNWGLGSGAMVRVTQTLNVGATALYVSDLAQFPNPGTASYVKIFSYTDEDSDSTYDEGEETGLYEVCRYSAKSAASGAGYLTIVRTSASVWNPSNAVVMYIDAGYDVNHISVDTKQFFFDGGQSLIDVLDQYAEHCGMIYYTKFKNVGTEWREYFYWIPKYRLEEDKGNYLELPTSVTQVTASTDSLIGSPGLSATIGLEDSFNAVMVEACRTKDSAWFYGYAEKPEVTAGTEMPRVLQFRSDSLLPDPLANTWTQTITADSNYGPGGVSYGTAVENTECQRLVTEKAKELLIYSNYVIPSYSAQFRNAFFELYQRVQFIGFPNIPEDIMRITEIEYAYQPPSDGGMACSITCSKATTLQESGKFQSIIDEIQMNYEKLKESASDTADTQKIGVVIATYQEGSMATVQLRSSGAIIKTRSYGLRKPA
jgi:hypothetical protein